MNAVVFQWPWMLTLLFLVPPVHALLAYARRERRRLIDAMGGGLATHRRMRDVLRSIALVLIVLALSRPGYAPRSEPVARDGRDVVFALDVSRSMLAEDVVPSRLAVAKQGIRDALSTMDDQRVGLVVYAGSASILCPLTHDYDFVRYMLEQANPRTVDFGGTTLQAAAEKVIDQVFLEGREGSQDLVVLTDGGDHGSQVEQVVGLLEDREVDVLLVGLGDPDLGSPIPVVDADGNRGFVEEDGIRVSTRLDDNKLREFAARSDRVEYRAVGLRPFHLGTLYNDYALGKPSKVAASTDGILVYKEAGFFFIAAAIILLLVAERWGVGGLRFNAVGMILILLGGAPPAACAASPRAVAEIESAVQSYQNGNYMEAAETLSDLASGAGSSDFNNAELAAIHLNRGLSWMQLAEGDAVETPDLALAYAHNAQMAFLAAKRFNPEMERAGIRLERVASVIARLRLQIEQEREADDEVSAAMDALIKRLQALLEAQSSLRAQVAENDVQRPRRRNADTPPLTAPPNAADNAVRFGDTQRQLVAEAVSIIEVMQSFDARLRALDSDARVGETLMTEPIQLMEAAAENQREAIEALKDWDRWPDSRSMQQAAEGRIAQVLDLLAGGSQQDGEGEEWEDYGDDSETEDADASEDSMSRSEPMQSDLAAGAEMQALPVPNYSIEDIIMEEQSNLQFRQQKRASANAGTVEKDY